MKHFLSVLDFKTYKCRHKESCTVFAYPQNYVTSQWRVGACSHPSEGHSVGVSLLHNSAVCSHSSLPWLQIWPLPSYPVSKSLSGVFHVTFGFILS